MAKRNHIITSSENFVSENLCQDQDIYANQLNNNTYSSEDSEDSDSEIPYGIQTPHAQENSLGLQGPLGTGGGIPRDYSLQPPRKKTRGRLKVEMKYLEDKMRRSATFNKRKNGMLKKAYELSTLTGTEILVVIASETGYIHTFATKKLQPIIASEQGQEFIQNCLDSEGDPSGSTASPPHPQNNIGKVKPARKKKKANVVTNNNNLPKLECAQYSPNYGQVPKTEPVYDGVYGQMPTNGMISGVYGQAFGVDETSNTSNSYGEGQVSSMAQQAKLPSSLSYTQLNNPVAQQYSGQIQLNQLNGQTVATSANVNMPQTGVLPSNGAETSSGLVTSNGLSTISPILHQQLTGSSMPTPPPTPQEPQQCKPPSPSVPTTYVQPTTLASNPQLQYTHSLPIQYVTMPNTQPHSNHSQLTNTTTHLPATNTQPHSIHSQLTNTSAHLSPTTSQIMVTNIPAPVTTSQIQTVAQTRNMDTHSPAHFDEFQHATQGQDTVYVKVPIKEESAELQCHYVQEDSG